MSSIADNTAAWQQTKFDKSFAIGPGPDQSQPAADEVVVKVAYVGIAPSEWKVLAIVQVSCYFTGADHRSRYKTGLMWT